MNAASTEFAEKLSKMKSLSNAGKMACETRTARLVSVYVLLR